MLENFEIYDFELKHYTGKDTSVHVYGTYLLSIGARAFYKNKTVKEVTVTDGVREVKAEAFAMCKNLTRITLPATITTIGAKAFAGCRNLTEVILPVGTQVDISHEAFDDWKKVTITRR